MIGRIRSRRGTVVTAACLLLLAAAVPAVASPATVDSGPPSVGPSVVGGAGPAAANNTTVQHENPASVERNGDLHEVSSWFANRLADRLAESNVALDEGAYERAREAVGPEYRRLLGRYVEVADDTGGRSDDRAAATFEEAGDRQRRFVDRVRVYRATYETYREARRLGDERSARQLARNLERIAADVNRTGRSLSASYDEMEATAGVDLDAPRRTVNRTVDDVSTRQRGVRYESFETTRLEVTNATRRIAFDRPLVVSGRVVAGNGSGVPSARVRLVAGPDERSVLTDAEGRFDLVYRPTLVPVDADSVSLRFVPADESPYLGATATLPVDIEPRTADLSITTVPDRPRYGDGVVIAGTLTVDGTPVAGVPVDVLVDGRHLKTATTGPRGFRASGVLDAAVGPGRVAVTAELPFVNRALVRTTTSRPVSVRSTETTLTFGAAESAPGEVDVRGRLVAGGTRAVARETVTFTIDGQFVGRVRTTRSGSYATTVLVPRELLETDTTVRIVASFNGAGTNLGSARAAQRVFVSGIGPDPVEGAGGPLSGLAWWHWLVVVAVAGGLAAGGYWARDRIVSALAGLRPTDGAGPAVDTPDGTQALGDAPIATEPDPAPSPWPDATLLLAEAQDRLAADDPDDAVAAAYAAIRGRYGPTLGITPAATHWEFFAACRDDGLEEGDVDRLRGLTEAYERAAFSADRTPPDRADEVLREARRLAADGRD